MDKPPDDHHPIPCPRCEYDLTGMTGERCPSCGLPIDPFRVPARSAPVQWGTLFAGAVSGVGTLVAVVSLTRTARGLTLFDAAAVAGALIAGAGHGLLAVSVALHWKRFPLPRGETSRILLVAACAGIILGLIGALPVLQPASRLRNVRGVPVIETLDYVLTAALFSAPGWMLLILRPIAFRLITALRHPERAAPAQQPQTAPFLIEASGPFSPDRLRCTLDDARRTTTAEIEALIEQTWEVETELARLDDRPLFDAPLARLTDFRLTPEGLELMLGRTTFREFLGTNARAA
ncbi:MAG: hypothetical protein D6788_04015, partial [Planctomycetota bacterium]